MEPFGAPAHRGRFVEFTGQLDMPADDVAVSGDGRYVEFTGELDPDPISSPPPPAPRAKNVLGLEFPSQDELQAIPEPEPAPVPAEPSLFDRAKSALDWNAPPRHRLANSVMDQFDGTPAPAAPRSVVRTGGVPLAADRQAQLENVARRLPNTAQKIAQQDNWAGQAMRGILENQALQAQRIAGGDNLVLPNDQDIEARVTMPRTQILEPGGEDNYKLAYNQKGNLARAVAPFTSGAEQGFWGIQNGVTGAAQFLLRTAGATDAADALQTRQEELQARQGNLSLPQNAEYMNKMLQAASASLVQNLPGLMTGAEAPALTLMGLQSFGQEYGEGRAAQMSEGEATVRASIFASAEVIGEKFGLGDTLKGLKAAAKGVPTKELAKYFGRAFAKEVPGEQLTSALQFGADKYLPQGLQPNATLEDYINVVGDTFVQTVLQSGMMMGGGAAISKTVRKADEVAGQLMPGRELARELRAAVENGEFDQQQIDREARQSLDPNARASDVVLPEATGFAPGQGEGRTAPTAPASASVAEVPASREAGGAPVADELLSLEVAQGQEPGGSPISAQAATAIGNPSTTPAAEADPEVMVGGRPLTSYPNRSLNFLTLAHPDQAIRGHAQAELARRQAKADNAGSLGGVESPLQQALGEGHERSLRFLGRTARLATPDEVRNLRPGRPGQAGSAESFAALGNLVSTLSGGRRKLVLFTGTDEADGAVISDDPDFIYVRIDGYTGPVSTVAHELTHALKQDLPKAYVGFRDAIKTAISRSDVVMLDFATFYDPKHFRSALVKQRLDRGESPSEILDDILATYPGRERILAHARGQDSTEAMRDWLDEEFHADLIGRAAEHQDTWQKITEEMARRDPGILRAFLRKLEAWAKAIKDLVTGKPGFDHMDRYVKGATANDFATNIEIIRRAAAQALARYGYLDPAARDQTFARRNPELKLGTPGSDDLERQSPGRDNATQGATHARNQIPQAGERPGTEVSNRQPAGVPSPASPADAARRGDVQGRGAGAGDSARPGQDPEVVRYGEPRPGAIQVRGVHYSREQRKALDSVYYGTGVAGAEAQRLAELPEAYRNRTYFYVDEGQGIFPEAGVGAHAHTVSLANLYDAVTDPLGLARTNRGDHNGFELAVVRAGFDGYYVRAGFGRQGVAALIGQHHVPVTYLGTQYRGGDAKAVVPAPAPKKPAVLTDRRLPMGQMAPAEWQRILGFLQSEEAAQIDWGRLDPGKLYYPEQLVREGMGLQLSPVRGQAGEAKVKSELEADLVKLFGFNVRGGVVSGAPGFIHSVADIKRQIRQAVKDARSDRSHPEDAVWYREAGRAIREYAHGDQRLMEQLTRLVAKLSQGAGVDSNVTSVIKAAYQMARGETPAVGRFPNAFRELFAPLMESPVFDTTLKGVDRKLQNFYRNLHDEVFQQNEWPDAAVIDRHAIGYIWHDKAKQTVDSDAQYDYAERVMQKATQAYNKETGSQLNPRDLQALLWGWWKRRDAAEAAKVDGKAFKAEGTAWNYPQFFERATANVTAEVLPSTAVSHLDLTLSPAEKAQFQKEALDLIFDKDGQNELARRSGLVLYTEAERSGGYEAKSNPNLVTGAIAGKIPKESGSGDPYHRYTYESVDRYALGWQFIFKQDGVPWFRADRTIDPAELDRARASRAKRRAEGKKVAERAEPPMMAKGFFITFGEDLTPANERAMFEALRIDVSQDVGYTKLKPNAVAVINYRDENGVPFLMSDEDFTTALDQFRRMTGVTAVESFAAESRYHYHDFHEDSQAAGILAADPIQSGERDLQDWLRGRREAFDALVQRWEEARPDGTGQEVRLSPSRAVRDRSAGNRALDGTELTALRRTAADLERPRDGIFLRVTDDGRAIATGPKGVRVPTAFIRFAETHGLAFEARRDGQASISSKTEPMPVEYRGSGAMYFGEGNAWFDRTGLTRFSPSRAQTESPAFKAWFGKDSNLRNADGSPMVLYHGTARDFTEFKASKTGAMGPGVYLGDAPEVALAYADGPGANVMPVYARGRYIGNTAWSKMIQENGGSWDKARTQAEREGVAGIWDQRFESAVNVFDPKNIKSAIGNRGTFDEKNPDIRFSPQRLAPNGKPSKLTEQQYQQVRTPAFKAWFGDWEKAATLPRAARQAVDVSKVIDENGEPLVVFHGTISGGFAAFRDGVPIFASSSLETAASYAGRYDEVDFNAGAGQRGVMPVFLNLRDPLTTNLGGKRYYQLEQIDGQDVTDAWADRAKQAGKDGVVIQDVIDDGGEFAEEIDSASDVYVVFDPAQVKSATANGGAFSGGNRDVRYSQARRAPAATWDAPEPTRLDKIIYELQDKHIDLKRVRAAIQANGREVKERFDPYLAEETYHGRAAWKTQHFLEGELKPLMTLLKTAEIPMADFERYLHARHAVERNARMAEINPNMPDNDALSGMTGAEAQQILAGVAASPKARVYAQLTARVDDLIEGTRNLLVASGLESPEMIAKWKGAYQHYVPLYRDLGEVASANPHSPGSGFSVRGASSKPATGSNKPVEHILSHIVMQREQAITRAEKNAVTMALYGMVMEHPNADFWNVVHPNKGQAQLAAEMLQLGFAPDVVDALVAAPKLRTLDPNTGLVVERLNPLYKSEPTSLVFRLKGEDRVILFSKKDERAVRLATSLKNMDVDNLHGALNVAARITRYFAAINTQYNPIFGLTNFARDIQGAVLNLSTTPIAGKRPQIIADALPAIRGIWLEERGRPGANAWATLYREFTEEGGATGYRDAFASSNDRAEALEKMLSPKWYQHVPALTALLDLLSDYNTAIENGIRLATYKAARDQGLSKQMAASIAKNITVNFNRKGRSGREINSLFAFFNAAVQGTERTLTTLRGPAGRQIIAGGLLLGAVQVLIGLAAFGDEWDDIPEFERQRNLIIPTFGSGRKYIKIPMPLGFHVLPNLARMATEMAHFRNNYGKRVGNLMAMLLETFNPLGGSSSLAEQITPTMGDPIVQLAANRDFTGREIAKTDRSGLAPTPGHTRAKERASSISKGLSKAINAATGGTDYAPGAWSPTPDQIDFIFGQLTGGVGRELNKSYKAVELKLAGEELAPHQIPGAGRFYGALDGDASIKSRYFNNVRDVSAHRLEITGRAKDGKAFQAYMAEHPDYRLAWVAEGTQRAVGQLEKYRRYLENTATDSAELQARKKEVDRQIVELMQRFNLQVEASRKEAGR
jgi:hypothetical protein